MALTARQLNIYNIRRSLVDLCDFYAELIIENRQSEDQDAEDPTWRMMVVSAHRVIMRHFVNAANEILADYDAIATQEESRQIRVYFEDARGLIDRVLLPPAPSAKTSLGNSR